MLFLGNKGWAGDPLTDKDFIDAIAEALRSDPDFGDDGGVGAAAIAISPAATAPALRAPEPSWPRATPFIAGRPESGPPAVQASAVPRPSQPAAAPPSAAVGSPQPAPAAAPAPRVSVAVAPSVAPGAMPVIADRGVPVRPQTASTLDGTQAASAAPRRPEAPQPNPSAPVPRPAVQPAASEPRAADPRPANMNAPAATPPVQPSGNTPPQSAAAMLERLRAAPATVAPASGSAPVASATPRPAAPLQSAAPAVDPRPAATGAAAPQQGKPADTRPANANARPAPVVDARAGISADADRRAPTELARASVPQPATTPAAKVQAAAAPAAIGSTKSADIAVQTDDIRSSAESKPEKPMPLLESPTDRHVGSAPAADRQAMPASPAAEATASPVAASARPVAAAPSPVPGGAERPAAQAPSPQGNGPAATGIAAPARPAAPAETRKPPADVAAEAPKPARPAAEAAPVKPVVEAAIPPAAKEATKAAPVEKPAAKPVAARVAAVAKTVAPKLRLVAPATDPGVNEPAPAKPAPAVRPVPAVLPGDDIAALPGNGKTRRARKFGWAKLSFFLAVLLPVVLVGTYYAFIASSHYRSEMRFAVRGTEKSTLENLGLSAVPGAGSQDADAYIVIDYIHSKQVLIDMQQKLGIDVRTFFSGPNIDFAYRIDPNMPLEKFIFYWRWMIDASYNSTTSITTFEATAFNGEDAAAIARAVLQVSNELVNDLSTAARGQLITTAQAEVSRTEERLVQARQTIQVFRVKYGTADPIMKVQAAQAIIQELEKTVIDLTSRRAVLLSTADANSPSVLVLDRQIAAAQDQLDAKRAEMGTPGSNTGLSGQLSEYNALLLEQEFAEKAYTTALSSLETSQAEARRQDRYFAIAVEPNVPEIALYPLRVVNTIIAFFGLCVAWLIGYLVIQAIRDHTV